METIHYISKFEYFSGKKVSSKYGDIVTALRKHIEYIGRKTENVFTFNLNINEWIKRAKSEIRKRWDSRVALKFVMALPLETNKNNVKNIADFLQNFIAKRLKVKKENISIAIHLHKGISGNYNPHAHILIFPRDINGKKLRLNKKDLSDFHREWRKALQELGYEIREDIEKLPHLGKQIHYDPDVQKLYKEHLELKEEVKSIKRKMNNHSREEKEEREGKEFEVEEERGIKNFFNRFFNDRKVKQFREKQKEALAIHFKRLGYSPDDKLAIVLVNHQTGDVLQRVFRVRELLEDRVLKFLSAKNSQGYSVYASVNTLKENALRRRKEDFKLRQRRIYLDLDSKELNAKKLIAKLYQYIELKQLPPPTHIVKSSKGNYQVYWFLKDKVLSLELEKVMEQMNIDLGLDHTQDVSRVFRLPYFRNKKPGKDDLVVNIATLDVYLKDKKVGEIKATGEPVSYKDFSKLLEGPSFKSKFLSVKDVPNIDREIEEFWLKIVKRQQEKKKREEKRKEEERLKERIRKYLERGYSKEVAMYRLSLNSIIENYYFSDEDWKLELESIVNLAFERNKDKSPSEVDIAILGLLFSKYNGKPPMPLESDVRGLIYSGAKQRGKADPNDYLQRTIKKVREYWEKQNRIKSYNDNMPHSTLSHDDNDNDFDFSP